MITDQALMTAVGKLMAMPFFPSDPAVKLGVADELPDIVADDEQLRWLVRRVLQLFTKWPGIGEIRAVYCSKFRPRDGVSYYSETYSEGIPSERSAAPPAPALPPGHEFTTDQEFEDHLRSLAKVKQFPGGTRPK